MRALADELATNFNPRSPCGERRAIWTRLTEAQKHFNPRSPCGERHMACFSLGDSRLFQSTLPVRGATLIVRLPASIYWISIHAPRAGSDCPP